MFQARTKTLKGYNHSLHHESNSRQLVSKAKLYYHQAIVAIVFLKSRVQNVIKPPNITHNPTKHPLSSSNHVHLVTCVLTPLDLSPLWDDLMTVVDGALPGVADIFLSSRSAGR